MMPVIKNNSPEILAPAGSMEALRAAVFCGANAVYMGAPKFSARAYAQNFDLSSLEEAVAFCRERGVQVHVAMNTLLFGEKELREALSTAEALAKIPVDAFIVQDLALAKLLKKMAPDIALHASTQLSVTDVCGAALMKDLGFSRVVVGREVTKDELAAIAAVGLETEAFVHGALCMSVSGQCYISAAMGGRSGNRGRCAGACRLPFENHCLSLKDMSLISHAKEMAEMGICSFKIEGRMRRPEYVAAAVTALRQALAGDVYDTRLLESAFSRSGLTDGYFTDNRGSAMFGTRSKEDVMAMGEVLPQLKPLCDRPSVFVPVTMDACVRAGEPMTLTVTDGEHTAHATGEILPPSQTKSLTEEELKTSLCKTGDTPYSVTRCTAAVEEGLFGAKSALNHLRRSALEDLSRQRREKSVPLYPVTVTSPASLRPHGAPGLRLVLGNPAQGEGLRRDLYERIALPLAHWNGLPVDDRSAVLLPRALFGEETALRQQLEAARDAGVTTALCTTLGAARMAFDAGMSVWGDFSLNCTSRQTAAALYDLGVDDITFSPECDFREMIRGLEEDITAGYIAYGHLPLMVTRNCPVKNTEHYDRCTHKGCYITDRMEVRLPVTCDTAVSTVLNPRPIWLGDRRKEYDMCNFATLYFTVESPREVEQILSLYQQGAAAPFQYTRGLSQGIAQWEKKEDVNR